MFYQNCSSKMRLLQTENEMLQKEQDRLTEVQTKILNEARKREQELRKQVTNQLIELFFSSFHSAASS